MAQEISNTECWKFPVPFIFNYFGSIANTCHKMCLTRKHYKETLEHLLTNVLEIMSESPVRNNLIHNDCDCIETLSKPLIGISQTFVTKYQPRHYQHSILPVVTHKFPLSNF